MKLIITSSTPITTGRPRCRASVADRRSSKRAMDGERSRRLNMIYFTLFCDLIRLEPFVERGGQTDIENHAVFGRILTLDRGGFVKIGHEVAAFVGQQQPDSIERRR